MKNSQLIAMREDILGNPTIAKSRKRFIAKVVRRLLVDQHVPSELAERRVAMFECLAAMRESRRWYAKDRNDRAAALHNFHHYHTQFRDVYDDVDSIWPTHEDAVLGEYWPLDWAE